jgi:hypothetical protein
MEVFEFVAKYLILPLGTIICTMGWRMLKKQDERIDALEARTNNTEKNVIEIRTEIRKDIQYMAEDIKEIKQLLKSDR